MEETQILKCEETACFLFLLWYGHPMTVRIACGCKGRTPEIIVTPHLGETTIQGKCEICGKDLRVIVDFVFD